MTEKYQISRLTPVSHERFPSSTDWINEWAFMALVSPQAIVSKAFRP